MPLRRKEGARIAANLNPSAGARQMDSAPNPGNESQLDELNPVLTSGWYTGTVVASFPGVYNCSVRIACHNLAIPCTVLAQGNGLLSGTGINQAWLPIEGSRVLVYKPDSFGRVGLIVATIPPLIEQPDKDRTRRWIVPSVDPEPGASFATEAAYTAPYRDPTNLDTLSANGGRPMDTFPGQSGAFNEMGLGQYMGTLQCGMRASEAAGIDFYAIDDLVRMYSGQFQHYNALGEQLINNDGGYQTYEWSGSPHMCEVFGQHDYGKTWLTNDTFDPKTMKNSNRKLSEEEQCLHRRYQMYLGHVSGLFSLFVANPDPAVATNTYSTQNNDQGLFSVNIDPSGRLIVSSAQDIILERTDRIPIPKKLKESWDPTGEQVDLADPYEEKEPFDWQTDTDPRNRALWLRDGLAWYKRLLYQRNDEAPKDWYVPEAADLRIPDDDYEKVDKVLGSEFFSKLADKRAILCLGADGTITLRGDGGAEIVLAGADVQINAPGDIRLKSGQNVVALGRDVVLKGKDSVDITATDKDIRLKAEQNLHLYSEKSIMLQSNAEADFHNWPGPTGEEQRHGGIIIQAKKSRVLVHGDKVHMSAARMLLLETLDSTRGWIVTSAKTVLNVFKNSYHIGQKGAGLVMNAGAQLYGKSVATVGSRSNVMIKGTKVACIVPWVDAGSAPYDSFRDVADPLIDRYLDDTEWLGAYTPDKRKEIQFTYRTSRQMGTEDGQPLAPPDKKFKLYEAYWAYMLSSGMGPTWLKGTTEGWTERPIDGTYAWPGEAAYSGGTSVCRLSTESNWESYTKPKKRKSRSKRGGAIQTVSAHDYRILKG